jgi:hypothetical protein
MGRTVCSGIAATTRPPFGADWRARQIVPWLARRRTSMAVAWADGGGSWSGRLPGSISFRRLRVRYDKRSDIHEAFLSLGCALICWQSLRKTWKTA